MKILTHPWIICVFPLAVMLWLLGGCGSAGPTVAGGGTGADSGPWPSHPAANTAATGTKGEEAPKASVTILLRATAAKDTPLALNVAKVELKYDKDQWLPVATGESINQLQALPLHVDEKGASALLSNGLIDRRAFNGIRLTFSGEKTLIEKEKNPIPLTVDTAQLSFKEWTPDPKTANAIILTLNGKKVNIISGARARLEASAVSVKTLLPTGGIIGTIAPVLPTAQVEVTWGDTKIAFGHANPTVPDGAFAIANLPPGKYQLKIIADGYVLGDDKPKPVTVEEKVVKLDKITLTKEQEKAATETTATK